MKMPTPQSQRRVPAHLLYSTEASSNNGSKERDRPLITDDHNKIDKSAACLMPYHPENQNNTAHPPRAGIVALAPAAYGTGTQTESVPDPDPDPDDRDNTLQEQIQIQIQIQYLEAELDSLCAQHTTTIAALQEIAAADPARKQARYAAELTWDRLYTMHQYARLQTNMQVMVRVRPPLAGEAGMATVRFSRDGTDGRIRVCWPRDGGGGGIDKDGTHDSGNHRPRKHSSDVGVVYGPSAAGHHSRSSSTSTSTRRMLLSRHSDPVVDHLFPPDTPNEAVFAAVEDLLTMAIDGVADVCILAYGQTGSGKSYTMGHIIDAAARKIFGRYQQPGDGSALGHDDKNRRGEEEQGVCVAARYIECYQEALYDLFSAYTPLSSREEEGLPTDAAGRRVEEPTNRKGLEKERKLDMRYDEARQRTEVTPVVMPRFRDAAALLHGVAEANRRRKTAATKLNARSSRSHAILTLYLDSHSDEHDAEHDDNGGNARAEEGQRGLDTTMTAGKSITLVDLAGSGPLHQHDDNSNSPNYYHQQRNESTAQARREETKKINLSLHELHNVIAQLSLPRPRSPRSLSSANYPQTNDEKKTKTTTTSATTAKPKNAQEKGGAGGFVPYNNSKLTKLLKYNLGFGAPTLFLVCVNPLGSQATRTEASLEFASCVHAAQR